MLMESFVAVMAMVAASVLSPGVYFAVNAPAGVVGTAEVAVQTISSWGFPVALSEMTDLARDVGENTLFNRTGGAPTFALGMAHIFAIAGGGRAALGFWYHFAIVFEALFILTILDTGTRVGRFMLQDLLGQVWKPLGRTSWYPSVVFTSSIIVLAWGYFLYQGVVDPLGGINSLWPLFSISNQLLATIALCVATTILVKMHRARYMWITCVPLVWLLSVTMTAAYQKVFSPSPSIGFLAAANDFAARLAAGEIPAAKIAETNALIFNNRLDAAVCLLFAFLVMVIVADSVRVWVGILRGTREARSFETPFVASQLRPEEL
jgi:carbon starvation protein